MLQRPRGLEGHHRHRASKHPSTQPFIYSHCPFFNLRLSPTIGFEASIGSRVIVKAMAQHEERTLSITNSFGERLAAKFVDTGSDDVTVLCHGYASGKDGFCFPELASALAAVGRSSLRFDFAGNGESEGTFSFGGYMREVEDLRAVVAWLREQGGRRVLAIVGHSKGGNVVLLYASKYDDVPYVVNVAGRGVMSGGIQERFGSETLARVQREGSVQLQQRVERGGARTLTFTLTQEAVSERMSLDMLAAARRIRHSRVLTLHGTADTVIPVGDAQLLLGAMREGRREQGEEQDGWHELVLVEGADHFFRRPEEAAVVVQRVVKCVQRAAGEGRAATAV
ncbi:hypothetical protein Agub_g4015 [Astrephomene gubernaculifera]|uniref:AB hydrolase-1 domain-containing protein n=1 Tax=Astrephomene gubernaculifera TaxID=47775 RepID=A0AAD3DKU4_9CHLO|nr:hypothetical protein Agub_g4015 [Astrephomene gubernaculifera]